jgi:UPF0755 protein
MRLFRRLILAVVILGVIASALGYFSLGASYEGFSNQVILDFPKGTSTQAMADQLADAGVIRFAWQFLLLRALRPGARLEAGEYLFSRADSPRGVYSRIVRGDVFFYEFSVPEGSNMFDIAASLSRFEFMKPERFLRAARNPALVHDLAPGAPTLEGYLFPSTYRITRATTEQQLCVMMTGEFRKHWRELQPVVAQVNELVTLASLVEKETSVPDERPIVASVYANRLRKGMSLDCDPTTIYAALLEQRYRGAIYRSDLNSANAYNTYKHAGMPPGPIANPGIAALKAALVPADTDYLFFVAKADGSGGHKFSRTIEEHNLAVQQYRRATNHQPDPPPAPSRITKRHRHA